MGYLYYGHNGYSVEIDDRPLAHLKIALLSLLRAGHGVAFCFERSARAGSGRETIWISPSSDIRFVFVGGRPPSINEQWVLDMIASAKTNTGLHVVPEPAREVLREPVRGVRTLENAG